MEQRPDVNITDYILSKEDSGLKDCEDHSGEEPSNVCVCLCLSKGKLEIYECGSPQLFR